MNKVILMGNLTRDIELRYSQSANPTAIARTGLAVSRKYKRQGEPDADFFNISAFGATAEFLSKWFNKGKKILIVGRIENNKVDNTTYTNVIAEEVHFADSKGSDANSGFPVNASSGQTTPNRNPFSPHTMEEDDDLPF